MVEASLVASAAVTALLLLAVAVGLARSRHRHPSLLGQAAAGSGFVFEGGRSIDRWTGNPSSWFAAFLLVTFGAAAAVMVVVIGDLPFAGLLLAASAAAVALGVTFGTYAVGRNVGLGTAGSTFVTAVLVGTLLLGAVVVRLFTFGG